MVVLPIYDCVIPIETNALIVPIFISAILSYEILLLMAFYYKKNLFTEYTSTAVTILLDRLHIAMRQTLYTQATSICRI